MTGGFQRIYQFADSETIWSEDYFHQKRRDFVFNLMKRKDDILTRLFQVEQPEWGNKVVDETKALLSSERLTTSELVRVKAFEYRLRDMGVWK